MKITQAMIVARRPAALLLILAAGCLALRLWSLDDAISHTVANDRKLYSAFQATERYVDAVLADQGRLPNASELADWANRDLPRIGSPAILQVGSGHFEQEAVAALGRPPADGYILGIWRGHWMEYYASWSDASTIPSNETAYYVLGSGPVDRIISGLAVLLCLIGSVILWGRRRVGSQALSQP